MKKQNVDMLQGTPWKQMLRFAIPVFFGVVFQQLYSTVDSIVVGNYLGSSALAAVTSSGHMIFMIVSLFHGFAQGAGIVIARFFGAGDKDNLEKAIHTDMVFGSILGILITVIGVLITPTLLRLVDTPAEMMQEAVTYFRVYFMGLMTLVIYNTCVGILQSIGDSKHPLYYLIISSLLNIVLDILFVGRLGSGVGGAALATIIAQGVSAV